VEELPFSAELMTERLLVWYREQGRDLPWRNSRDPYRIWLSEVMLQQTTVAAVIEYYHRFLKRFPTVQALAVAEREEVLTLWAGLGYYSRARNLHKAAQKVATVYNGEFPQSVELLQQLPGIGRSTAGAIVSLAFDRPEPILDGNVRRVLCRLLAVLDPARDRKVEQRLWRVAKQLVPVAFAHDYTQAIMDLGATVCRPKQPDCLHCPLVEICLAKEQNLTAVVPVATNSKKVPTRYQAILLIEADGKKLIRRRKSEGLLGGMLEFPTVDLLTEAPSEPEVRELLAGYGCSDISENIGSIRHSYSHFRLEADVYTHRCRVDTIETDVDLFWQPDVDLDHSALHGAHKKALALSRAKKKGKT